MSEAPQSPRPPRRKRYSGKNPRNFKDKYKEHQPEKYTETIEKVLASGKTPAGMHVPIMLHECLENLGLDEGHIGIDATLGYGGHAQHILSLIAPHGKLFGLDRDSIELAKATARLRELGFSESHFESIQSNYAGINKILAQRNIEAVDFILADLGCSSMQFDNPLRGFSYKLDGPLDMRMNSERGITAADWLKKITAEKFENLLIDYSDEVYPEEIANHLAGKSLSSTMELTREIRRALSGKTEELIKSSIKRCFQTIRIAVNEEYTGLDALLNSIPKALKSGGRAVILTFHSGEDRRVKQFIKAQIKSGVFTEASSGHAVASAEERYQNPRSSSAKLRWMIKK